MCRLAYVEKENSVFNEKDVNVILKMNYSAYEHGNRDGYFIRFSNGKEIRTLNWAKYMEFISENYENSQWAFFHLRMKSNGDVIEDWVHGWQFKHKEKQYNVAHNGIFTHNSKDKKKFDNDSYQFFYNMFRHKGNTLLDKLKKYAKKQSGGGVIGAIAEDGSNMLFAGVDRSFYIGLADTEDSDRLMLIGSQKDILDDIKDSEIEVKQLNNYKGLSFEVSKKVEVEDSITGEVLINRVEDGTIIYLAKGNVFKSTKVEKKVWQSNYRGQHTTTAPITVIGDANEQMDLINSDGLPEDDEEPGFVKRNRDHGYNLPPYNGRF
jgi:hypothetical protein